MKIKELHNIQNKFLQDVGDYFLKVEKELKDNIKFKVSIEEMKTEQDEVWCDYVIKVGKTKFMLDCSTYEDYFRLAVFNGTKLAEKCVNKCNGEWDETFENYELFLTEDLKDVIDFFKWVEENYEK